MKKYKEMKKIANKIVQINRLVEKLKINSDIDTEGIDFFSAKLVSGLSGREDGLYSDGEKIAENEGDYYCSQSRGYGEDDYYGHLYYATDVPGQYVSVWFDM